MALQVKYFHNISNLIKHILFDITMLMFTKQQQFSTSMKEKRLEAAQYSESQTSETLTSLSNLNREDINVYFDTEVYSTNTVSHTLSHKNMSWLQKQVQWVLRKGTEALDESKRQLYEKKLNQLSSNLSESLIKIEKERERMRNKMVKIFLLRSREAHKKNVLCSNLKKYKELLIIIKTLRDKSAKNEEEINDLKKRLQTSCLFLAPSLVERSLVSLALKSINKEIPILQIKNLSNLRIIVCYFFESDEVNNMLGLSGQQSLYSKFKTYLLLKNYLKLSEQTRVYFNELCQKKLSILYQKSLEQNRQIEHWKIGSLVQSSEQIKKFYRKQSIEVVKRVVDSIIQFKNGLKYLKYIMASSLIEQINKKKKLVSSERKTVPKNMLSILKQCRSIFALEKIEKFFDFFQKRWFIVEAFEREFDLTFRIDEIRSLLLKLCVRSIISPFLQVLAQITKKLYAKKKQRHYHLNRLIYQQMEAWKFLLQDQEAQQRSLTNHLNEMKLKYSLFLEISYEKTLPSQFKLQHKQKTEEATSLAKFCLEFNACFGTIIGYFANKIDSKFQQNQKGNKIQKEIQNAWVLLISSSLADHLIQELEPGSLLRQIQLFSEQILNSVQEQHRLENELDKLHSKVAEIALKKKKKKKSVGKQEEHEKIYEAVLYLNEKVANYEKLMELVIFIGAQQEINKLNENLYYGACKKILG